MSNQAIEASSDIEASSSFIDGAMEFATLICWDGSGDRLLVMRHAHLMDGTDVNDQSVNPWVNPEFLINGEHSIEEFLIQSGETTAQAHARYTAELARRSANS